MLFGQPERPSVCIRLRPNEMKKYAANRPRKRWPGCMHWGGDTAVSQGRRLMIDDWLLVFLAGLLVLTACSESPPATAEPLVTAALIACDERIITPTPGSILPAFQPAAACELENAAAQVDFCLVQASDTLSYPCSRHESVQETAVSERNQTLLIQRDHHISQGCWTAVTTDTRTLWACDKESGTRTILVHNVYGAIMPSPDGEWLAFVATEPEEIYKPHIFRARTDGTELTQLDSRPFPLEQVPGIQILQWSADDTWLELSLWDGHADSIHRYRVRTDGSGEFQALP